MDLFRVGILLSLSSTYLVDQNFFISPSNCYYQHYSSTDATKLLTLISYTYPLASQLAVPLSLDWLTKSLALLSVFTLFTHFSLSTLNTIRESARHLPHQKIPQALGQSFQIETYLGSSFSPRCRYHVNLDS